MATTQYCCQNQRRRTAIRETKDTNGRPLLNGIDYLEVTSDRKTLWVYFIHPLSDWQQLDSVPDTIALSSENVRIAGGERQTNLSVESASSSGNCLTLRLNQSGDFSTYTLRLIQSPAEDNKPPQGFDSQLSQVEFKFWAGTISEFDCQPSIPSPDKLPPPPVIDYLAKDYDSFRRLMLDRLAVTLPDWQERNAADIGMMLVELVAYAADRLSYHQDAVATEAYLGTARKRVSVRRHARMLDYFMHDGCNARAWVTLQVGSAAANQTLRGANPKTLQPGTTFLTQVPSLPSVLQSERALETAINAGAQVFEAMHDLVLHPALNTISFYTWGDDECSLPVGATQATLNNSGGLLTEALLSKGKVLIFEEVKSPITGEESDRELTHRHAVRLTEVSWTEDRLFPEEDSTGKTEPEQRQRVVTIQWGQEDALPFPLQISSVVDGKPVRDMSIVLGNVVLVDRGCTVIENLPPIPPPELTTRPYRPQLQFGPLTQHGRVLDRVNRRWLPFDAKASASAAFNWQLRDVRPSIVLVEMESTDLRWYPQPDLLNSAPFARDFVVETEDDGRAYLRFGDSILGKRPNCETQFKAIYRMGNGTMGNVGAEAIAHIYLKEQTLTGIEVVRNPLPAKGGTAPEPIEQVRLYAPQAFHEPKRAVTPDDYAMFAQQFSGVRQALATRRWTGSWYTMFITVDREGGRSIDSDFEQELQEFLEPFRLAGHDLKIESPRFVSLDIALKVQVAPDYFKSEIKEALFDVFSNRVNPDGQLGFFYPDNFTFTQPVYLSQVIATAVKIPGVRSAQVTRFQRWGQPATNELDVGQIQMGRLEIARLNNDPNAPEQGRIVFNMEGGL
jgi:hypothetical protein